MLLKSSLSSSNLCRCFLAVCGIILLTTQNASAQGLFVETGFGIGNIAAEKHRLGKGEVHLTMIKPFRRSQVGLDISTGGNLVPGDRTSDEGNTDIISPYDARFLSATAIYRLSIRDRFFIEPRVGYSSLNHFIFADNKRQIRQSNLTAGLGFGARIDDFTASFRYQYLGETPDFFGPKDDGLVRSDSEPIGVFLLRLSYSLDLKGLFGL